MNDDNQIKMPFIGLLAVKTKFITKEELIEGFNKSSGFKIKL